MAKRNRLHFSASQSRANVSLELIFRDVWGPAPFTYLNGNKYYVSFLDSFDHFTWLFLMHSKLDESTIFLHFQKLVERLFERKIKSP
jgi:hypothetical protein